MSFLTGAGQQSPADNPEYKKSPYQRDMEARAAAALAAEKSKKKSAPDRLQQIWDAIGGKVD